LPPSLTPGATVDKLPLNAIKLLTIEKFASLISIPPPPFPDIVEPLTATLPPVDEIPRPPFPDIVEPLTLSVQLSERMPMRREFVTLEFASVRLAVALRH